MRSRRGERGRVADRGADRCHPRRAPQRLQRRPRRRRRPDPVRPGQGRRPRPQRSGLRRHVRRRVAAEGRALARLRAHGQPLRVVESDRHRAPRALRPGDRCGPARRDAGGHRQGADELHVVPRHARPADGAEHRLRLPVRRRRSGRRRAHRATRALHHGRPPDQRHVDARRSPHSLARQWTNGRRGRGVGERPLRSPPRAPGRPGRQWPADRSVHARRRDRRRPTGRSTGRSCSAWDVTWACPCPTSPSAGACAPTGRRPSAARAPSSPATPVTDTATTRSSGRPRS